MLMNSSSVILKSSAKTIFILPSRIPSFRFFFFGSVIGTSFAIGFLFLPYKTPTLSPCRTFSSTSENRALNSPTGRLFINLRICITCQVVKNSFRSSGNGICGIWLAHRRPGPVCRANTIKAAVFNCVEVTVCAEEKARFAEFSFSDRFPEAGYQACLIQNTARFDGI